MKNHLSWVNRNLIQYFNYAASPQNSEIVGLLPFFWYDTVNSDDQFCGAYRYPEQIEILKDISEKNHKLCKQKVTIIPQQIR